MYEVFIFQIIYEVPKGTESEILIYACDEKFHKKYQQVRIKVISYYQLDD
jgi:hypothetical protein